MNYISGLSLAFLLAISVNVSAQSEPFYIDDNGVVHIKELRVEKITASSTVTSKEMHTRKIVLTHPDAAYQSWGKWEIWTPAWKAYEPVGRKFGNTKPKNLMLAFVGPNNVYNLSNSAPRIRFNGRSWIENKFHSVGQYTKPDTIPSDARLKKNVGELDSSAFDLLHPVTYNLIDPTIVAGGKGRQIGFIADEVEQHFPELVFKDVDGYRRMRYGQLTAVLTSALQETRSELQDVKKQLADEREHYQRLELRLQALEQVNGSTAAISSPAKTVLQ